MLEHRTFKFILQVACVVCINNDVSWSLVGAKNANPVAGIRLRSLTLFPLKQISYTFMCFKNSDKLMVVRIFRLNFTFRLKLRILKTVLSLLNDIIGFVSECLQVTC